MPVQLWTSLETIAFTPLHYLAKLPHISAESVLQGFQLQQQGSIGGPASQGEGIFNAAALLGQAQVLHMLRHLPYGSSFTPFNLPRPSGLC